MSSILQELEAQINNVNTSVEKTNIGIVRETGDGVAKVEGLSDAQLNEMIEFPGGLTGLALNLEEGEVGVVFLGDGKHITEGMECKTTGKLLSIPVGENFLGRVVNTLAEPIDGKGEIAAADQYPVEKIAPGIIKRKSVSVPLQTGIAAIDAMIPIGRGQRELIIGDRSTGKTTIAIDTIISQSNQNKAAAEGRLKDHKPVYCVYVGIGQKQSNIARTISILEEAGALDNTIIVSASDPTLRPTSSSPLTPDVLLPSISWTKARTCLSSLMTSPSRLLPIVKFLSFFVAHPVVKHILVMFSTFTRAFLSVPHVSPKKRVVVH